MKITCIGDIHSRHIYYNLIDDVMKDSDVVVFLGDYVDPYSISKKKQKKDYYKIDDSLIILKDIIELKKKNKNKVILLLGNHDTHYLYDDVGYSSRYDDKNAGMIKMLYRNNKDLFQYCYQFGNHIFTHAGITKSWIEYYKNILYDDFYLENNLSNLGEVLNNMSTKRYSNKILNSISYCRGGGDLYSGPTWSDYTEHNNNILDNIHQYVGHNKVKKIHTIMHDASSITYCDVLETPDKNLKNNYKTIIV